MLSLPAHPKTLLASSDFRSRETRIFLLMRYSFPKSQVRGCQAGEKAFCGIVLSSLVLVGKCSAHTRPVSAGLPGIGAMQERDQPETRDK